MGWNVYLYHGHLTVDPPFRDGPTVPPESEQNPFGYHQVRANLPQTHECAGCSQLTWALDPGLWQSQPGAR